MLLICELGCHNSIRAETIDCLGLEDHPHHRLVDSPHIWTARFADRKGHYPNTDQCHSRDQYIVGCNFRLVGVVEIGWYRSVWAVVVDQFVGFNVSFFHLLLPDNWWYSCCFVVWLPVIDGSWVRYGIMSYRHLITYLVSWQFFFWLRLFVSRLAWWRRCSFVIFSRGSLVPWNFGVFGVLPRPLGTKVRSGSSPTFFCSVVSFAKTRAFWICPTLRRLAVFSSNFFFLSFGQFFQYWPSALQYEHWLFLLMSMPLDSWFRVLPVGGAIVAKGKLLEFSNAFNSSSLSRCATISSYDPILARHGDRSFEFGW